MSTDDRGPNPTTTRPAGAPGSPQATDVARTATPPEHGRGPRPVPSGVPYHRVLAGERRRIGRGVLALALLLGGLVVLSIALNVLAAGVDFLLLGRVDPALGGPAYTGVQHAGVMAGIALLVPWSMLIQRWLYGVRGPSLHSVLSVFRLDLFARALLLIGPIWAVQALVMAVLLPAAPAAWEVADLYGVLLATLLLTPLQAAGEEYGLRGLAFRIVGGWARGPRAALVVGVLVTALIFTVIHQSTDPWLNLYYFATGVALALITWRTGGLEVAVAVHALQNTVSFVFVLVARGDLNLTQVDRSAGVGTVAMLVPCLFLIAVTAVVWWRTRRTGPALTA
jgi:membrane protease YdiL (CAAX protease family)